MLEKIFNNFEKLFDYRANLNDYLVKYRRTMQSNELLTPFYKIYFYNFTYICTLFALCTSKNDRSLLQN